MGVGYNREQGGTMQQELQIFGAMPGGLKDVPGFAVAQCSTEQAAIRLCVYNDNSGRSQEKIADAIGWSRARFNSGIHCDLLDSDGLPRKMHRFSMAEAKLIQKVCGNRAISQWWEMEEKGLLDCQKVKSEESEEFQLLRRLAEIRSSK